MSCVIASPASRPARISARSSLTAVPSALLVVAFGYMTWGRRTIEAVLAAGHEVALIVTHPDSDNAYEKIFNESIGELAAAHDIPLMVRNRADDEVRAAVAAVAADVMVVSNWRTWIPPEVFSLPRLGTLNAVSYTHLTLPVSYTHLTLPTTPYV